MSHYLLAVLAAIFLFVSVAQPIQASSAQAYQDYLYQFDIYRSKYNDFKVAKNEYEKFKTLESQTKALSRTANFLTQRDQLLRAYLFLLNEKLNENRGLNPSEKQLYQTLIGQEITFLENHTKLIPSIDSLNDAVTLSEQLESHYLVLQTTVRQIVIGLQLGQLATLANQYDAAVTSTKNLLNVWRTNLPPPKQATVDRWLLQISNKRSLYQQEVDSVTRSNAQLHGNSLDELEQSVGQFQKNLTEAHQYLVEGGSYLRELINSLRWND